MTSYFDSAAQTHGLDTQVTDDERYEITEEHINAVDRLWEGSWRDDAVVRDTKTREFDVANRVRQIIMRASNLMSLDLISMGHFRGRTGS